jgi:outer membrane receptor protein involved in Fe transport
MHIPGWKTAAILVLQLIRGFVSGSVTDSTNAVIPGVQIVLTNKQTNIPRETVTNELGFYRFVAVEPGEYTLEFRKSGFETHRVDNVTVKTAQEVVINQTLALAPATVEIAVVETLGAELAKTTATVDRTFVEREIVELPMQVYNGTRDITRLALLAPTVTRAPSFTEFSANGQRSRNNNFILDGVDNNDTSVSLNSIRIIPEAVQEVQVQTVAYSTEFGRSSGAQFSAVTRAGTNQYHGDAWEYYRGNWMEPLSLTNKRAGLRETPRYTLNQFGGDLGGPIFKDRTFFFGLLEANRRREAASGANATAATIPTPAGYAALSNVPLGTGETATARLAALSALSFLPDIHSIVKSYQGVQNTLINGVPIETGTIRIPVARPSNFWYSVGRIDHRLSAKDNLSYRYHFDQSDQPNVTSNLQFGTRFGASSSIRRQNHAISYTRTFTNRFLNEARVAYVRGRLGFPENDPTSPTVTINGFFTIGGLSVFPQGRTEQLYQYQDVATYISNRHSLKFGLDVRHTNLFNRLGSNSKGTWTFATLADFLNSTPLNLTQAVNEASFEAKQWNQAYFFQDDFKATKDLTFNLGLRYEYSTVPFGFFGATDPAIRAVGIPGPVQPDKNNWAPRVGFAYSPSKPAGFLRSLLGEGQTSIRGGFGMAYDVLFYNILIQASNNYPRIVTSTLTPPATANLFPTLAPKTAVVPPLNPLTTVFINVPEDTQNPTTNFWTLSVQRQFRTDYILELGYAGNRSYHQIRQRDANPGVLTADQAATVISTGNPNSVTIRRLNPAWGPRTLLEPAATGEYHAGYVKFDKRMSKGLLVGANYTWSATFSDNDEAFGGNDVVSSSPQVPQNFFNYRNEWSRSAFDRPHRVAVYYLYDLKALGGWQISGETEAQSGQPFTIRTGVDTVGSLATAFPGRPNYNPNGVFMQDPVTGDLRTFVIPTNGTGIVTAPLGPNGILANSMPGGGNLGRNTFRGPSFQNWNLSVMKKVSFKERWQLQIRSDFVNVWNHNNFQNPVAVMSSPAFGQNTATPVTDTRLIMLSAKLKF